MNVLNKKINTYIFYVILLELICHILKNLNFCLLDLCLKWNFIVCNRITTFCSCIMTGLCFDKNTTVLYYLNLKNDIGLERILGNTILYLLYCWRVFIIYSQSVYLNDSLIVLCYLLTIVINKYR